MPADAPRARVFHVVDRVGEIRPGPYPFVLGLSFSEVNECVV